MSFYDRVCEWVLSSNNNFARKIYRQLKTLPTDTVKLKHPEFMWYAFDMVLEDVYYNIYVRDISFNSKNHKLYYGIYEPDEAIRTGFHAAHNLRIKTYTLVDCSARRSKKIYVKSKKMFAGQSKKSIAELIGE
jgi:hypothetical protein